jgi:DNA-binding protein HU-beta
MAYKTRSSEGAGRFTLQQLTLAVAHCNGITEKEAREFIDSFSDLLTCLLLKGERVKIPGIGTIYRRTQRRRMVYNFSTEQKDEREACVTIGLRPSATIKNRLRSTQSLNNTPEGSRILSRVKKVGEEEQERFRRTLVRDSFRSYLRESIQHGSSWVHPVTNRAFTAPEVKKAMEAFRTHSPNLYLELWKVLTDRGVENSRPLNEKKVGQAVDAVLLELVISSPNPQKVKHGFAYE